MNSVGFPPIAAPDARVLILGSLPGQVSLLHRQYYAQAHNAFWPIMEKLLGIPADSAYAERTSRLAGHGVALWDVCASAHRPGSLDAAISFSSVAANDFAAFLASYPQIGLICFNGAKAAELYRRIVFPGLPPALQKIPSVILPSTSPAHAAMPFREKLRRWSEALLPRIAAR